MTDEPEVRRTDPGPPSADPDEARSEPGGASGDAADDRPAATAADPEASRSASAVDVTATSAADPEPTPPAADAFEDRDARLRRLLRLPRSRAGIFALLLVLGGAGLASIFGGVSLVMWTETDDFCGRCHSMAPELAAYASGPHRQVTCGECHVEPGIDGWIKAKLNGTRQLAELVLGTYPTPIPPPDHAALPSAKDTCMHCHNVERTALATLKTRTQFTEDEANTRQFVGLMIRPGGGDVFDVDRSVHWHVLREVRYWTPGESAAAIDYVVAVAADGSVREFIAQDQVKVADDVRPDIDRIKAVTHEREMTCYDCHNRVGHPIANPRREIDRDLAAGVVDASLPYLKREAMRVLWGDFPDMAAADRAADRIADFYGRFYPDVAKTKSAQIEDAVARIKVLYRLSATPEMRVTAATYPDHLGHMDSPGCFRCHDGGHFLVQNGVATTQAIPSTCDTCHTFPQIGPVASLPLGVPPETHDDGLWVFNHRGVAPDLDPGGTSCGECHARDYCVNCHATGAVTVDHDEMLLDHARVIRESGNQACAYCHQPVYCARCHADPVLPTTLPPSSGRSGFVPPGPPGLQWPLVPAG